MAKQGAGPQQREVKWDERTVKTFTAAFARVMQEAEEAGVPMPVMEAMVRDWLASLEALRQAKMLAAQWQALGAPGFQFPH